MTRLLLTGLTLERADQIAPRARAWLAPAPARVTGAAAVRFEPSERAYVIEGGRIVMEGSRDELLNNEAVRKAYIGA